MSQAGGAPAATNGDLGPGASAQVANTDGAGVRVRAAPSLSAPVRTALPEGTPVQVVDGPVSADGYDWYRIETEEGSGWVAGQFLLVTSPARAPVARAAPPPPAATTPSVPATVVVPPEFGEEPAAAAATPTPAAGVAIGVPPPAAVSPPVVANGPPGTITTVPGVYQRLGGYQAASPEYGMNIFIWGHPETTARDLGRLRELGFGWQKTLFQWRGIEYAGKGQFDWSEADRVVRETTAAGIKIIARLDFPPDWARSRQTHNGPPDRLQDFGDFVRAFVARYGSRSTANIGRVHAIQVWNEANLSREWGDRPINQDQVREWVNMLKVAYEAAKSVDPDMTVISGGLTPTGTMNDEARDDVVYLQWMYDAGAAAYFDVLGAHGAGYKAPPEMSPDDVAADPSYGGHPSFSFRRVEQLRQVMERNGDGGKQIWLLEFGWTSDEVHPAYAWHRVSEEQKAEYIVRAYQWAAQHWAPWIGVMTLWNMAAPGWTRQDEEYWWSITNPDGSPRPAYNALRAARQSGELP